MQSFEEVELALPEGRCDGFDWQRVGWFVWSKGELRIDPASFSLIFLPLGGAGANPLGCLSSAVPCKDTRGGRAIVVKTNDAMHSMLRLAFTSRMDEENFLMLAQSAETAASRRACPTPCRTPRTSIRRRSLRDDPMADRFTIGIGENHPESAPLIYSGVELYGPDPFSTDQCGGSEVLLGRGAVVLVDPAYAGHRVGTYELVFYDEDLQIGFRSPIGPRMKLTEPEEDFAGARLTLASRVSMSRQSAARAFDLTLRGEPARALSFDTEAAAAGFARDFEVRQRVVALALKASRGLGVVEALRQEMDDMRRNGLLFVLRRLLGQLLLLIMAVLLAQIVVLRIAHPERPLVDIAWTAASDASATASAAGEAFKVATEAFCMLTTEAVPSSAVRRCASLPKGVGEQFLRRCVLGLVPAPEAAG